jgi:hypothetical protein
MRVARLAACALAIAIAISSAASAQRTPAKDSFTGQISKASGRWAADDGQLGIDLATPSSGLITRKLMLTFHGRRCGTSRHCVKLTGTVRGTLTAVFGGNPDAGRGFSVHASGTLKPLGHVSASGTVHGTGFIAHGRIEMTLALRTSTGKLTVTAQSGLVNGFTSP